MSSMGNALAAAVEGPMWLETTALPPIPIVLTSSDSSSLSPEVLALVQKLKPKLTAKIIGDPNLVVIAPFGDPGATQWPLIELGLAVGAVVIGGFLVYGVASLLIPRKKA